MSILLAALSLPAASARQQGAAAVLDTGPGPTSSAHGPSIVLFYQVGFITMPAWSNNMLGFIHSDAVRDPSVQAECADQ